MNTIEHYEGGEERRHGSTRLGSYGKIIYALSIVKRIRRTGMERPNKSLKFSLKNTVEREYYLEKITMF